MKIKKKKERLGISKVPPFHPFSNFATKTAVSFLSHHFLEAWGEKLKLYFPYIASHTSPLCPLFSFLWSVTQPYLYTEYTPINMNTSFHSFTKDRAFIHSYKISQLLNSDNKKNVHFPWKIPLFIHVEANSMEIK